MSKLIAAIGLLCCLVSVADARSSLRDLDEVTSPLASKIFVKKPVVVEVALAPPALATSPSLDFAAYKQPAPLMPDETWPLWRWSLLGVALAAGFLLALLAIVKAITAS